MKLSFYNSYLFSFFFLIISISVNAQDDFIETYQDDFIETYLESTKVTDIKNDGVDLWVATEGDGIFKYSKAEDKWENFSSNNKKIKQNFFYCIEVGKRYIWAGSADGLYTFDKERKRWRKKKFSLGGQFGNWIRSLKFDRKRNILWIGRFKYLSFFNLKLKKYSDYDLTVNKDDRTNTINTIAFDFDDVAWIGVEAGLHRMDKKTSEYRNEYFNNQNGFFLNEGEEVSVTNILFEQNNIWFGTEEFVTYESPEFNLGGLFRFDRKIHWLKFGENNNKLKGNGIYSIEKIGNYIWASVYKFNPETKIKNGQGINTINRKTLASKKISHELIPNDILKIHFDGNNIWLGTKNGLRKIILKSNFIPDFN